MPILGIFLPMDYHQVFDDPSSITRNRVLELWDQRRILTLTSSAFFPLHPSLDSFFPLSIKR